MTPQEKGSELVTKYYVWGIQKEGQTLSRFECKQLALIAVDEFIRYTPSVYLTKDEEIDFSHRQYREQVKEEITKL